LSDTDIDKHVDPEEASAIDWHLGCEAVQDVHIDWPEMEVEEHCVVGLQAIKASVDITYSSWSDLHVSVVVALTVELQVGIALETQILSPGIKLEQAELMKGFKICNVWSFNPLVWAILLHVWYDWTT
jgi:hypothetical protein